MSDEDMLSRLMEVLRALFAAPDSTVRTVCDVSRFGIGFCPGCKRLRGAASLVCTYCGNTRTVVPDA
jgi:hypothetical protein